MTLSEALSAAWSALASPDAKAAFWAGVGGALRAVALRTSPWESVACVFMAVVWGILLYPFAGPIFDLFASPIFGKALGFGRESVDRVVVVLVGLSGVAITGFVLDFFSALKAHKIREASRDV